MHEIWTQTGIYEVERLMYQEKMTGEYLAIREIKAKLKKEQLFLDEKFKATKKVLERVMMPIRVR